MKKLKGKMLSKKTISIILVTVLIAGGTGYSMINKFKQGKEETEFVAKEREYKATRGNITAGVKGAGTLKLDGVKHKFDDSVVVGEVFVKVGQSVKAGDKLVSVSEKYLKEKSEELNKQLNEALLALNEAKGNKDAAVLTNEKNWNDKVQGSENQYKSQRQELDESIKDLTSKNATLNNKIKEVKTKIEELSKNANENMTLLEELKANENSLIVEKANLEKELEASKKNLSKLEENRKNEINQEANEKNKTSEINNISIKSLDNAINLAQESVNKVKEEINKLNKIKESPILYAEVDGIVSAINTFDGAPTKVEDSIVDIGQSSKVTAEIVVSQNDIVNIEEGQKVIITVSSYESEKFEGKVKEVNYKPNPQGNTTNYTALVELEPTDYKLLEGMTVTAQFILHEVKDAITISNKAITFRDGKQFVKLKNEDGSTTEINIQTGFSDGKVTEVISGLNDGDTVVVGG